MRDSSTEILLEAANFEPFGLLRTSERLKLRTEGSNRWEKGVDPYLAPQAASFATQLLVELADARWLGAQRRPRRAAAPPRRPAPACARRRADRARDASRRAAQDPHRLRLRGRRRLERDGPHVAKPGRDARGRSDRGDRAGPDGRGAVHAAGAPRDVRVADAASALAAPHRGRARGARPVRDLHAVARAGGGRARRPGAARPDGRPGGPAADAPARPASRPRRETSRSGTSGSVSSRSRASTSRRGTSYPRSSFTWAASSRAASRRSRGSSSRSTGRSRWSFDIERDARPFLYPGRAARVDEGWLGELHPTVLEGTWGVFELDLEALLAASREPIQYEDVITYPGRQAGSRVRRRRVGCRRRSDRGCPRGGWAGAPRAARLRRLSRRAGGRGEEVDRVRGGVPVAGADALRRRCGCDPRADRGGARRAIRRGVARLGRQTECAATS